MKNELNASKIGLDDSLEFSKDMIDQIITMVEGPDTAALVSILSSASDEIDRLLGMGGPTDGSRP